MTPLFRFYVSERLAEARRILADPNAGPSLWALALRVTRQWGSW